MVSRKRKKLLVYLRFTAFTGNFWAFSPHLDSVPSEAVKSLLLEMAALSEVPNALITLMFCPGVVL
jgi:hypothetical protein